VVAREQRPLVVLLREQEEDEQRAEDDRDDAGQVGPLVALEERLLGRRDDLGLVLRVALGGVDARWRRTSSARPPRRS
jgi:hypothetical protein